MRRAIRWSAIPVLGLGMFLADAAVAADADVTVLRGMSAKTTASTGAPTVLRGMPAGDSQAADAKKLRSRRVASSWISTGGDSLWLVESDGGGIVGCWLQGSGYAGRTDIRCARRGW